MRFKAMWWVAGLFVTGMVGGMAVAAEPLKMENFNPGEQGIFPVSSELISGKNDAVLIDAQFQRNHAQELVKRIQRSGKRLTTIYISHSDPDYYFGLDVLHAAFPKARIIATAQTVAAIKATSQGKKAYWGPQLGANAPQSLVLPEVLKGDKIHLEGQVLEIRGLQGPVPDRSYVWIPSLKAVVGGVILSNGIHVWMADTPTAASRQHWLSTLDAVAALQPKTVIPGHYLGELPAGWGAVGFTLQYLQAFENAAGKSKNSADLVSAMKQQYPALAEESSLELSAKVVKGEMKWPAE